MTDDDKFSDFSTLTVGRKITAADCKKSGVIYDLDEEERIGRHFPIRTDIVVLAADQDKSSQFGWSFKLDKSGNVYLIERIVRANKQDEYKDWGDGED